MHDHKLPLLFGFCLIFLGLQKIEQFIFTYIVEILLIDDEKFSFAAECLGDWILSNNDGDASVFCSICSGGIWHPWLGGAVAAHIKPLTFEFLRLRQSLDHRDRA